MNFLGFGQSAEIDIVFDGSENRKTAEVKTEDGSKEKCLLFYDGENVSGKINVTLKKPGSKLEHHGIKVELIGQIELFYDRGNHHEFTALVQELARPGDLIHNTNYPFEFANVEKPYEVYAGSNVRLRYFLRATIIRRLSDIVRTVDFAVHTLCSYPDVNNPIKMEVGIEDCLHIEFEYNKSKYHLEDVIIGKIYFLLVRIKIKNMEIAIIKKETTGSIPNMYTENETIAKYEIMDGAPVRGESIPIRVFLSGYDLTPTMRDVKKKFTVKYFLNLVLMDTEERRYFKQQEITLWRKADKPRKNQNQPYATNNPHVPSHLVGSGPSSSTTSIHRSNVMVASESNDGSSGEFSGGSNIGTVGGYIVDSAHTPLARGGSLSGDISSGDTPSGGDKKMGLFTRESPNQDVPQFCDENGAEHALKTEESSPNVTASAVLSPLPKSVQNATSTPPHRGRADGAASITPPPLPTSSSSSDIYTELEDHEVEGIAAVASDDSDTKTHVKTLSSSESGFMTPPPLLDNDDTRESETPKLNIENKE